MKRILSLGLLLAIIALFANVETARADHRSCYGSRRYSNGYYGSPYQSGYSNYGYSPSYNYVPGYGYVSPLYGYYGHPRNNYYGGSGLYLNSPRGGFIIRF